MHVIVTVADITVATVADITVAGAAFFWAVSRQARC
jgi:nitrogen fixation-related uncharacterized protein